jgi:hypothetical protein
MLTVLFALAPLVAGEIFGDLRSGDTYLEDVPLQLTCGSEVVEARTDREGSFRLRTKATGKCRLAITWRDESPAIDVVVFARPTRYRLVVEQKDGKYVLKRV